MKHIISALVGIAVGYLLCAYTNIVDKETWMHIGMDTTIKAIRQATKDGVSCLLTSPVDGTELKLISSKGRMIVRCEENKNSMRF